MKSLDLQDYINNEFLERKKGTTKELNIWIKDLFSKTDKEFIKLFVGVDKKENQSFKDKETKIKDKIKKEQEALKTLRLSKPKRIKKVKVEVKPTDKTDI
jgi:hypothetical protein